MATLAPSARRVPGSCREVRLPTCLTTRWLACGIYRGAGKCCIITVMQHLWLPVAGGRGQNVSAAHQQATCTHPDLPPFSRSTRADSVDQLSGRELRMVHDDGKWTRSTGEGHELVDSADRILQMWSVVSSSWRMSFLSAKSFARMSEIRQLPRDGTQGRWSPSSRNSPMRR